MKHVSLALTLLALLFAGCTRVDKKPEAAAVAAPEPKAAAAQPEDP